MLGPSMLGKNHRINGIPEPQARPRLGRGVVYSPKSKWWGEVVRQGRALAPATPLDEPLRVTIDFFLPRPKSIRKDTRWQARRPDIDNLTKSTLDALTRAGWWTDDGLVAILDAQKLYADDANPAGAVISVQQIME